MSISICIPTYNGEKYLHECINSVLAQTVKDFEIIFCDDCSTDGTVEIIRSYQLNDSRIKLFINEKNLGLVGNWNRCIEKSNGEWIKFIFQDDLMENNYIETLLPLIKKDARMIVCEREFLFEKDITPEIKIVYDKLACLYHFSQDPKPHYISVQNLARYTCKKVSANYIGEPSSIMFHRSCVNELGGFSADINQICDLEYWLRIGLNYGLMYVPQKLVTFRVHASSATQKNNSQKFFTSTFLDKLILLHKLLFDPLYSNFRKYNGAFHLFKFRQKYYYTIYHAEKYLRQNDTPESISKDFEAVRKKFPGMHIGWGSKLIYSILELILPIVRMYYRATGKDKLRNI